MLLISSKCLVGTSKTNEILAVVPSVSQSSVSLENASSFSMAKVHINIISVQENPGIWIFPVAMCILQWNPPSSTSLAIPSEMRSMPMISRCQKNCFRRELLNALQRGCSASKLVKDGVACRKQDVCSILFHSYLPLCFFFHLCYAFLKYVSHLAQFREP